MVEIFGSILLIASILKVLRKTTSSSTSGRFFMFGLNGFFNLIGTGFSSFSWLLGYNSKIYGSARFMSFFEKRGLMSPYKDGLCIDGKNKISFEMSSRNLALVAPTGGGKSTVYILPNLLNLHDHSVVVTDPSGELHNLTHKHLESQGYEVKILNVSDLSNSLRYNPLHRANTFTEIQKISNILISAAYNDNTGANSFWNDSAENIINILIRAIKTKAPRYQNLHNLNNLVNMLGGSDAQRKQIDSMMSRDLDDATFSLYEAFVAQDQRVMQSILSTAKTALSKVNDPILAELTASETLNFETLRTKKTAIFLIIPEHEIRYYGFLITLLYTQIFNYAMQPEVNAQPYNKIMFLLDEFGNCGKLPNFSTIITTLRKRKCSVSIVLQDIMQLENLYGRADASTILNGGCASQIYFPGLSHETCQKLEQVLGKSTITHRETGFNKRREEYMIPERDREMGRSLLTADEIRTLRDNQAIFIHSNKRPIMLKTTPFYKNPTLLRRTK